ncbi:sensor histidine kinase [Nocardia miyunensis]|uniref:sensor histidine kinase n=1 Tax=Nocardia miyunensis TaxID=282684 RepID=UPI000834FFAD|nr:histidine kinase [Nocardia miyunensis]
MEVLRIIVLTAAAVLLAAVAWYAVVGWRHARQRIVDFWRDPRGTFEQHVAELPFDYPPAVIVSADLALFVAAMTGVIQRHDYIATALPILALLLVTFAFPILTVFGVPPRPVPLCIVGLIAQGIFLLQPVRLDASPFVLVVVAGEVAAIASKRISLPFAVIALLELLLFHFVGPGIDSLPAYLVGVVLGTLVGLMMQYQRLYLYKERENQEIRAAQAADEERRRIAREVHDVIAHSLSVTLLHLTAARHSLQTDRDVDEAIDALTDAERLGRQAMADIRHTVGLLDQRPSSPTPEPGVDDIDALVEDFVRAGLAVDYSVSGDITTVSATTGLALFRISRESLANIAKHAPDATATLRIEVTDTRVTVVVTNTLSSAVTTRRGRGMGISGMRQRATLIGGNLTAGPRDGRWEVRAGFPITDLRPEPPCPVTGGDDHLRPVRDAITSLTRKLQEGM